MSSPIPIFIESPTGEQYGVLESDARTFVARAEQFAMRGGRSKRVAGGALLVERLEAEGFQIASGTERQNATKLLENVRQGQSPEFILVRVIPHTNKQTLNLNRSKGLKPVSESKSTLTFFDQERHFPNNDARTWYESLIGLEKQKERLSTELESFLFPERLKIWSENHHGTVLRLVSLQRNRVPLIILEGDVGTGKTALAETIGDAVARVNECDVHLLKVNAQVRGSGQVGEMSQLIAQAFRHATRYATTHRGEPVILLIDEADSLTESRENQQMHHEDRAGLNALLQQLDNLRLENLPIVTLFITNRPNAIDPAVRRRASLNLRFERPNDVARERLFKELLSELNLSTKQLKSLVEATGKRKDTEIGFTASDITDRLLPAALRNAYPTVPLSSELIEREARAMKPTPAFQTE